MNDDLQADVQVVFRNLEQTDAIAQAVSRRVKKLERYCGQIIKGRVVIDSPHNNRHKGKVYSVSVEIHAPQAEVRVNHDHHDKHEHEDLYVAIRDAFDAAERQFKSADRKHRTARNRKSDPVGAASPNPS